MADPVSVVTLAKAVKEAVDRAKSNKKQANEISERAQRMESLLESIQESYGTELEGDDIYRAVVEVLEKACAVCENLGGKKNMKAAFFSNSHQADLNTTESRMDRVIIDLQTKLLVVREGEKVKELEKELQETKEALEALEKAGKEKKERIEELEETKKALEKLLEKAQGSINALEKRIKELEEMMADGKYDVYWFRFVLLAWVLDSIILVGSGTGIVSDQDRIFWSSNSIGLTYSPWLLCNTTATYAENCIKKAVDGKIFGHITTSELHHERDHVVACFIGSVALISIALIIKVAEKFRTSRELVLNRVLKWQQNCYDTAFKPEDREHDLIVSLVVRLLAFVVWVLLTIAGKSTLGMIATLLSTLALVAWDQYMSRIEVESGWDNVSFDHGAAYIMLVISTISMFLSVVSLVFKIWDWLHLNCASDDKQPLLTSQATSVSA